MAKVAKKSIFDDAVANVPFDESSSMMLAFDEKDGSDGGRLVSSEMTVSRRSKDCTESLDVGIAATTLAAVAKVSTPIS